MISKALPFQDHVESEFVGARVITVTPAFAATALETVKVVGNRPLSQAHVNRMVEDMKKGEWVLNGEPIIFDQDGNLLDGQHRLWAVALSGVTIQTYAVFGISTEAFKTLDMGRKRSISDLAGILDLKDYKVIGAAMRFLYRYEKGGLDRFMPWPNNLVLFEMLKKHKKIEHSAPYGRRVKHLMSASLGTFCHYILARINHDDAEDFFYSLETGEHLHRRSPIYWLRERLIRERSRKTRLHDGELVALVFKAWNLFRKNQEITYLKWAKNRNEPFPKPV